MSIESLPAVTLPVRHLNDAADFYTSALLPLGYRIISYTDHYLAGTNVSSRAVSFGPIGTNRVDLMISQSSRDSSSTPQTRPSTINFTASSEKAVRDFWTSAVNHPGARNVVSPSDCSRGFQAVVSDLDGNRIRVTGPFDVPVTSDQPFAPSAESSRSRRLEIREGSAGHYSRPDMAQDRRTMETAHDTMPVHWRSQPDPDHHSHPPAQSDGASPNDGQGKTGTSTSRLVLGAAVTATVAAGVAHVLHKEYRDSKEKDRRWNEGWEQRDQLEQEARRAPEYAIPYPPKSSVAPDRDSGYYSIKSTTSLRYHKKNRSSASASASSSSRHPVSAPSKTSTSSSQTVKPIRAPPPTHNSVARGESDGRALVKSGGRQDDRRSHATTSRSSSSRHSAKAIREGSARSDSHHEDADRRGLIKRDRRGHGSTTDTSYRASKPASRSSFAPPTSYPLRLKDHSDNRSSSRTAGSTGSRASSGRTVLYRPQHGTSRHSSRQRHGSSTSKTTRYTVIASPNSVPPAVPNDGDDGGLSDLDTIVPDDSISQVSSVKG